MKLKALLYRLLGYKTLDELLSEIKQGKRLGVDGKEIAKAKKLEDALYPANILIPAEGDVFEATEDVKISYMTYHFAPYTGGGEFILPKGERIISYGARSKKPSSISCEPMNYQKLEAQIPLEERQEPTYSNYSLSVNTKLFHKSFRQIELPPLTYVKGDATRPIGQGNKILVHVCNDVGGWGKGFVMAISRRWESPEARYREWFSSGEKFELGEVQFVQVEPSLWVANMIAQRDVKPSEDGIAPIREVYISRGLAKVKDFAKQHQASVHMPRIGCGLAGGKWEDIEPRIKIELVAYEIKTYVYDFE